MERLQRKCHKYVWNSQKRLWLFWCHSGLRFWNVGRSVPRLYAYLEIKTTGPHNFRGCNGYPDMIVRVMILLQGQRIMCAIHNPIAKTVECKLWGWNNWNGTKGVYGSSIRGCSKEFCNETIDLGGKSSQICIDSILKSQSPLCFVPIVPQSVFTQPLISSPSLAKCD